MTVRMTPEIVLGARVVAELRAQQWRVYQEVTGRGGRADIVATQGPFVWVVECKIRFGLDVLAQAWGWRKYAHFVSIAVWSARRSWSTFGSRVLADYGIGCLVVDEHAVHEHMPPAFLRRANTEELRGRLTPDLEAYGAQAGNADSHFYSRFKQTCTEVQRFVKLRPGCTLKQVIEGIRHHYASTSSARASLAHWMERGKVPGVRLERDGKVATVWPT